MFQAVPINTQHVARAPEREWQSFVDEIAHIDVQETNGALRMGDLLLEVERKFGGKYLRQAAETAGITWKTAKERMSVSRRIPLESPIRKMRTLSFSHLRALAQTPEPEVWARRCEEDDLSAARLIEAIHQAGDEVAQAQGDPCHQCGQPLPLVGDVIAVTIGRGRRTRLCRAECVVDFITADTRERSTADPFAPPVRSEGPL